MSVDYRRWAFESAALDLALRQAGASLADALGLRPAPSRFVVSTRLDEPADAGAASWMPRPGAPACASSSTRPTTGRTS